jgi:hypothetical protein
VLIPTDLLAAIKEYDGEIEHQGDSEEGGAFTYEDLMMYLVYGVDDYSIDPVSEMLANVTPAEYERGRVQGFITPTDNTPYIRATRPVE